MSEHQASLTWQRQTPDFHYDTYNRIHRMSFDDGTDIEASAAPGFNGGLRGVDPEEALVAATSSCHMLTFLAVCAKRKYVVDRYTDQAVGILDKDASGRLSITKITLSPRVVFGGDTVPDTEGLAALHDAAHRNCFIANSIKADVVVMPQV
jgi:organic hydroperoxide reductase OsmC/OhrA